MARGDSIISTFREIGRDLLKLEINTIEKPNLSARKMPVMPHALLDIAEDYLTELTKNLYLGDFWNLERDMRPSWNPWYKKVDETVDWKKVTITNGPETFDKLRWAAACALWAEDSHLHIKDPAEHVILSRIRRNCDQLKGIIYDLMREDNTWSELLNERTRLDLLTDELRYLPMSKLPVDYAIAVRKIWEMGTEKVLMQTVIQIDGDVISRIQENLPENKQDFILSVHEKSVDVSMRYWQILFDIVKQIAGGLAELFLPRSETHK